ncbi:MurR/RpiR family transcriptional regulator [Pseudaminobacter soli (ex Li et al. 2025)]|uniref:MurR/RpiR family transcriptional regulator n=1 Tax=Pseudaminobacter soli (ex Li et al. 2025) TaxID=1295366 RepID=A0A2P7S3V0_9HYPH|nr:MurR/RpiR family transcriptional regulator [Mesorhizobium soli]PSJ57111.1 MurR/RpiR family transcriptional regulator [Mesorhizobium soli]
MTKTDKAAPSVAIDIVSRIQRAEPNLSAAERRVAEAVQADMEAATLMTIAELAERAGVSQPSVTRFCRSIGCSSFNEFKISLATTVTVAAVYLRSDRVFRDDIGQLAQMVMMRAANTVRDSLDRLDTNALEKALEILSTTRRIDIYGQGGGSASLAEDTRLRLFRLGIPTISYVDGHQQRMSAATLQPEDSVIAISNSGRSRSVVQAVEIAGSFGAKTIALTRLNTPLAKAAQVVIPIEVAEDDNVLLPTPSRYAFMAVIDTIAAGVAARLGQRSLEALRRVRYTVASIGIAIPTPSTDPTPLMKNSKPE